MLCSTSDELFTMLLVAYTADETHVEIPEEGGKCDMKFIFDCL